MPVRILDDEVYEESELFVATLMGATQEFVTLNPASATVNIIDEDGKYKYPRRIVKIKCASGGL